MQKVVEVEQESLGKEKISNLIVAYQQWLTVAGRTKASIKNHLASLTRFWVFLQGKGLSGEGEIKLETIDREVIAAYQSHVFEYVSPLTKRQLDCRSQINLLGYLKAFFTFLEKTGRVYSNPCESIRLPREPRRLPPPLLTPEEMRKLLSMPNLQSVIGFRDRCILEILWSSAPRLAELITLTVEDVNLTEGLLTIREGKGRKDRVVPLGMGACAWVRAYLQNVRPLLLQPNSPDKLLLTINGEALDHGGCQRRIELFVRRAHLPKSFTVHTFRHQLATDMLKNGADLRYVQQMLGHEHLTTTQRYLHVVKKELKRVHRLSHPKERLPITAVNYRGSFQEEEE